MAPGGAQETPHGDGWISSTQIELLDKGDAEARSDYLGPRNSESEENIEMGRLSKVEQLKADYPDQPWRWKREWTEGGLKGGSKQEAVVTACLGLALLGLSALAMGAIPAELEKGNRAILVVLFLGVVGVALLGVAFKRARQFWRYGALTFEPEPILGSWGG